MDLDPQTRDSILALLEDMMVTAQAMKITAASMRNSVDNLLLSSTRISDVSSGKFVVTSESPVGFEANNMEMLPECKPVFEVSYMGESREKSNSSVNSCLFPVSEEMKMMVPQVNQVVHSPSLKESESEETGVVHPPHVFDKMPKRNIYTCLQYSDLGHINRFFRKMLHHEVRNNYQISQIPRPIIRHYTFDWEPGPLKIAMQVNNGRGYEQRNINVALKGEYSCPRRICAQSVVNNEYGVNFLLCFDPGIIHNTWVYLNFNHFNKVKFNEHATIVAGECLDLNLFGLDHSIRDKTINDRTWKHFSCVVGTTEDAEECYFCSCALEGGTHYHPLSDTESSRDPGTLATLGKKDKVWKYFSRGHVKSATISSLAVSKRQEYPDSSIVTVKGGSDMVYSVMIFSISMKLEGWPPPGKGFDENINICSYCSAVSCPIPGRPPDTYLQKNITSTSLVTGGSVNARCSWAPVVQSQFLHSSAVVVIFSELLDRDQTSKVTQSLTGPRMQAKYRRDNQCAYDHVFHASSLVHQLDVLEMKKEWSLLFSENPHVQVTKFNNVIAFKGGTCELINFHCIDAFLLRSMMKSPVDDVLATGIRNLTSFLGQILVDVKEAYFIMELSTKSFGAKYHHKSAVVIVDVQHDHDSVENFISSHIANFLTILMTNLTRCLLAKTQLPSLIIFFVEITCWDSGINNIYIGYNCRGLLERTCPTHSLGTDVQKDGEDNVVTDLPVLYQIQMRYLFLNWVYGLPAASVVSDVVFDARDPLRTCFDWKKWVGQHRQKEYLEVFINLTEIAAREVVEKWLEYLWVLLFNSTRRIFLLLLVSEGVRLVLHTDLSEVYSELDHFLNELGYTSDCFFACVVMPGISTLIKLLGLAHKVLDCLISRFLSFRQHQSSILEWYYKSKKDVAIWVLTFLLSSMLHVLGCVELRTAVVQFMIMIRYVVSRYIVSDNRCGHIRLSGMFSSTSYSTPTAEDIDTTSIRATNITMEMGSCSFDLVQHISAPALDGDSVETIAKELSCLLEGSGKFNFQCDQATSSSTISLNPGIKFLRISLEFDYVLLVLRGLIVGELNVQMHPMPNTRHSFLSRQCKSLYVCFNMGCWFAIRMAFFLIGASYVEVFLWRIAWCISY